MEGVSGRVFSAGWAALGRHSFVPSWAADRRLYATFLPKLLLFDGLRYRGRVRIISTDEKWPRLFGQNVLSLQWSLAVVYLCGGEPCRQVVKVHSIWCVAVKPSVGLVWL